MYRLTKWQRFWKLDVPSSMIGLVWNMMMSMGGGWFFLTASEAVTVFIHGKSTPIEFAGIGSFMGAAVAEGSIPKVFIGIVAMVIIVVGTNFLVFRPLVAWARSSGSRRPRPRTHHGASCSTFCDAPRPQIARTHLPPHPLTT